MELFKPDNFSSAKIHFKECGSDNLNQLAIILKGYFHDFEIEKVYRVDRAEIQTQNYKIILRERNGQTTILLKKYKVTPDLEQTEFYLNLLILLLEKGVLVSRVLKTLDGRLTVSTGDEIYSAFEFIKGDHFVPSESGWTDVARNMAKMHTAFNEFNKDYFDQIDVFSKKGYYPFNIIKNYSEADLVLFEEKIRNKDKKEEIEQILLEKLPIFKRAAAEVDKYRERISRLPGQIIHSDFHPHNILMNGDEVRAIIDFENVRVSQQARDVAFAIYKFGRQFFVSQSLDKDASRKASQLKDLFINNYSQVKPITAEEIELLPVLAKDTFIKKLLFVLKGVYEEGNDIWRNDLPKHIMAMEEIDYFWS